MARAARSLQELLVDLRDWGERVDRVVSRTSADTIREDEMAELALSRVVEIFGEIAGRIPKEFPDWASGEDKADLLYAYRLRNKLAHGYEDVRVEAVYKIAGTDVRRFTVKAKQWLIELDAE